MLLTISTTHRPATDLGYLLAKHPGRVQSFQQPYGTAHVFYPEASEERCTAALLIDIDPVGLVRGKDGDDQGLLSQYVNDRPYAASSLLSAAIADVFRSALNGRCKERPELVDQRLPLEIELPAVPCRGNDQLLQDLFGPLGYTVATTRIPLDERFPAWGESPFQQVRLSVEKPLQDVLSHLYVLLPVLDNSKHYFVAEAEIDKLMRHGESWLAEHPLRDLIVRRYLKNLKSLSTAATARMEAAEETPANEDVGAAALATRAVPLEVSLERSIRLNDQRLATVTETLRGLGTASVIDLGCGEGRLIRELLREPAFTRITGMDVSVRELERAASLLNIEEMPQFMRDKLTLLHGSLTYRDARMNGYDAAAVIEVIEHLDPPRLTAFEQILFGTARPRHVIVTTPNREYNQLFAKLKAGGLRHPDHRFEWTRAEFHEWAQQQAGRYGYSVAFKPVGVEDEKFGPPTQMAVFSQNQ